uniref:Capsid polyprotein VP90 n=1 Tax=Human astrovirus-1 TaxID=12456 RepID=Q14V11_HASV1|nr:outer capsid protein [Human astrovirus 1]
MASKSHKEVTVEVSSTGRSRSKSRARSQSRGRGRSVKITVNSHNKGRRQNGRNKYQSNQRVRKIVNKQLRKPSFTGPKPCICETATATLGTIGSNTTGATEIEACILLNPVLVKDATGSTQFGPVQALGAQYSMWKLKYLNVRLTSMVGASAVNGTVVRISLNPTSTPSSTSWSGLGARKHLDVTVGKNALFKLKPPDLGGPRDGWWLTNTIDNASDTLGPSIEIHTFGQTMSSYQNTQFTGGLFWGELASAWCFTGYAANPNLVNLVKSTDNGVDVTFEGSAGTPLIMNVPEHSHFARMAVEHSSLSTSLSRVGGESSSDTVWQVLNTAVSAAELVTPPPFNWLVKGGWWFVKLIVGRARTGARRFYVYPSYQDALSNKPALWTGGVSAYTRQSTPVRTTLQFTQMNQPSLGHGATPATLGQSVPEPGDQFKVIMAVGALVQPNRSDTQIWLFKTVTPPTGHDAARVGWKTQHYLTKQGFLLIDSLEWLTPNLQDSQEPPSIPELGVYVGIHKKALVYFMQQYVNPHTNNKHQVSSIFLIKPTENFSVTNYMSYFFRVSQSGQNVANLEIRPQTWQQTVNFQRGKWYLVTNTAIRNGPPPSGWVLDHIELPNESIYYADQVLAHLINPPPQNSKIYFEVHTTMPQSSVRNIGLEEDQTDNWQEPDEDVQTSTEESDYETDSLEDDLMMKTLIHAESLLLTLLLTRASAGSVLRILVCQHIPMLSGEVVNNQQASTSRKFPQMLLAQEHTIRVYVSANNSRSIKLSGDRGHAE